jgi:pimeloyl-ACP methyl ester carboxylesterase
LDEENIIVNDGEPFSPQTGTLAAAAFDSFAVVKISSMKQFLNAAMIVFLLTPILASAQSSYKIGNRMQKFIVSLVPTLKTITLSNNITLEYAEQGYTGGTPVIFLHGYTDSWHSYETVLPLLPESIRAFALTQRGHGDSDKPDEGYNPKDFANDVALFIKQKKLNKVIIVGHSLGGLVAQRFVLDNPQLCKGVVIISSDASFADNPGMSDFLAVVDQLQEPVDRTFSAEFQKSTITKPIAESYFNTVVNESEKVPARVWKAIAQELRQVNYVPELKTIKQPVLIFWGDKDGVCFKNDQEVMVRNIKNAKLLVYQGTGHALHWEEPARFASDLLKFVESFKR